MQESLATVVIVPRERFSAAAQCLESVYGNTSYPFELVVIDAGSPRRVRRYLQEKCREKKFRLIRVDRYLSQNQSRNLALQHVATKYVAFLDNDVLVAPGWLGALVRCAEETNASIVGPLLLMGDPHDPRVHMAGGTAPITERDGKRFLNVDMRYLAKFLRDVPAPLRREACGLAEFHCMLVRRDVFDRVGPFDEEILCTKEHVDLSLLVAREGGTIYFEPTSVVTYLAPPPLKRSDLRFFTLVWSDEWYRKSIDRLCEKWNLQDNFPERLATRKAMHFYMRPFRNILPRSLQGRGFGLANRLERGIQRLMEIFVKR